VSQNGEELELQAMERQLDDAFQTTRPRTGFEDELWQRIQSSRPAPRKFRDALGALWNGVREVPAVSATATALVLIVAVGVGIFTVGGFGRGSGGAGSSAVNRELAPNAGQSFAGTFGRLPSPVFSNATRATPTQATAAPLGAEFAGPVQLQWTGTFDLKITTAPVFRYREPSTTDADQFATALGAVLRDRSSGFLGTYSAADYQLKVRGTVTSPPSSPAYFIMSGSNLPASDAAGGPQSQADVFLAQHSLAPQWPYAVMVDSSGDPVKVVYQRQFDVPNYGSAYLVDSTANRYGLEVDLSSSRVVMAFGMLPLSFDVAYYNLVSSADAIRAAVGTSSPAPTSTAAPVAKLDHAELVYVLVPAGDHSFYEPAVLFTGTLQSGGQSYTKHVLIPAVDPKQRS
jgi:hypothetical protein